MKKLFVHAAISLVIPAKQLIGQSDSSQHLIVVDTGYHQTVVAPSSGRLRPAYAIIPATLITYGVLSLNVGALKDVNEYFQRSIWIDNPHSKTSIDNYLQWAPGVALYGLRLAGVNGHDNVRDMSIIYGTSILLNSTATHVVKAISNEWRPDGSDNKSFPSGHTSNAFVAAELIRLEYKHCSPWYGIAGYAVAATTGYFRMYNNKHWFGDIIAGAGFGILSTDIVWWTYPSIKRWLFPKERSSATMILPYYDAMMGAGIGLVHRF